MTLRSSDLQSDSDLDSIRNSCDVSIPKQQKCPLDQIMAKGFQKEEKNSLLTLLQPFLPESLYVLIRKIRSKSGAFVAN